MRIFLTGASGQVGIIIVSELLGADHTVIGSACSDEVVDLLVQAGVEVYRGSLDDMESLIAGAQDADDVIHLAFKHNLLFRGNMIV
jgi:uncharacterized protein YbjT (DUF2867 family)